MATTTRTKNRRLEVRTTTEERELIDRAADSTGTDLTSFVVEHLVNAARQILADRETFRLSQDALDEWERVNHCSAKELTSLRRLMERPSPFTE
ncbi:MAG: DUF1778 domain-containing protein [Acidimicrobiales bacterium]|jgi:uncharacterized protein (DUF1778 family)